MKRNFLLVGLSALTSLVVLSGCDVDPYCLSCQDGGEVDAGPDGFFADVTFEDRGPDVVQNVFRSVELDLPDLEPGEYTLHLRLDLAGRTPLITSRPIIVY